MKSRIKKSSKIEEIDVEAHEIDTFLAYVAEQAQDDLERNLDQMFQSLDKASELTTSYAPISNKIK